MIEDTLGVKVTVSEVDESPTSSSPVTSSLAMESTTRHKPTSQTASDNVESVINLTEPESDAEPPVAKKAKVIDVERIIMGQQLSDVEINFAPQLLKEQFPKINGLMCTLYQEKQIELSESSVQNKLQIIYCRMRHHWIVASTMNCRFGEVRVFDSLFHYCDEETEYVIAKLFQCGPKKVTVKVAHSQKQKGGSDCGVYAIAFATAIAYEMNAGRQKLKQEAMRPHLVNCFTFHLFHCAADCFDFHYPVY